MVRLHKYFFEENEYNINERRQGNSQRSRKGRLFTDYTSDAYRTFELTLDNLSEQEHYNLLYITSLVFPSTGGSIDLDFVDPHGGSYIVSIPVDGYNYNPKNTEEDLWVWEITLEEVI